MRSLLTFFSFFYLSFPDYELQSALNLKEQFSDQGSRAYNLRVQRSFSYPASYLAAMKSVMLAQLFYLEVLGLRVFLCEVHRFFLRLHWFPSIRTDTDNCWLLNKEVIKHQEEEVKCFIVSFGKEKSPCAIKYNAFKKKDEED